MSTQRTKVVWNLTGVLTVQFQSNQTKTDRVMGPWILLLRIEILNGWWFDKHQRRKNFAIAILHHMQNLSSVEIIFGELSPFIHCE